MRLPFDSPPDKICLLRLSSIGDITHMLPIVHTLRNNWPDSHVSWIIGKHEARLVGDLNDIEFIVFDKSKGWRAYQELHHQLSGKKFAALLHMQVSMRANLASVFVNTKLRIGYDAIRAKDMHGLFVKQRIPHTAEQHVLDSFFSFLEILGLTQKNYQWDLPIPEEAFAFADKVLPNQQPTLIISPCSSHKLRNWSAKGYAQVADHAINTHGMRIVLCGGPSQIEQEYGNAITTLMHGTPVNLIGKDTLKKFLALLKRADALLSPDSGPAHMATCVDTPVIGLFAASNVRRTGPYLSRKWCVDRYEAATRKFKHKAVSEIPWGAKLEYPGVMDLIRVEDVTQKLDALMATLNH